MKIRLSVMSMFLAATVIAALAGCNAGAASITSTQIDTTPVDNITSLPASNTPVVMPSSTASSTTVITPGPTPSVFTSTPVTFTQTPAVTVPPDSAVYPPIVAGVVTVILADGHFSPPIIKIPVGITVEWQATDHLGDHAVYAVDGTFWGLVIAWIPLDKTFSVPGTYNYHDMSSMGGIGTVIVY